MLMLTHTYILQNILAGHSIKTNDLDIYVYNIIPDLLTIHPAISSRQTHIIRRLSEFPPHYSKAAYIMFHLLVDDLAHYGLICPGIPDEFSPDSQGYSYIKGKSLVNQIWNFQKTVQKEVFYNEAVYRSHLIIEMIYDLVIIDYINASQTIELLTDAVCFTVKNKMEELIDTVGWLYGLQEKEIQEVMNRACSYVTKERIQKIMNIEGRIRLYIDKFGLKRDDPLCCTGMRDIFLQAKDLFDDKEIFLKETTAAVKKHGWLPPAT